MLFIEELALLRALRFVVTFGFLRTLWHRKQIYKRTIIQ